VARYNGPGSGADKAFPIAVDSTSGNVYVTGSSSSNYATVAYDSLGNELWVARYNGPDYISDTPYAIAVDPTSGNIYVTGACGNYPSYDYATVAYDSSGNELWEARYSMENSHDAAKAITIDPSTGDVYVAGSSDDINSVGSDYATVKYSLSPPNTAPVASAGPDQNVTTGSLVTLDGSGSSDPDGDALTYSWSFVSNPGNDVLSDPTAANPSFTPGVDGSYVLSLVVNDGTEDSSDDAVTITSTTPNRAPVADAGADQNVATGSLVVLDGSGSSDSDGDALTYNWSFVLNPGNAVLSGSSGVNPTFTPSVDGSYMFSLIVSDGKVSSSADTVTIVATTPNTAPVADAGADQHVITGSLVVLDGSGSSDADGDALTYNWSFISNTVNAVLSDSTAVNPTFTPSVDGVYTLSLTVNDGTVSSSADTVTVTATTPNRAPVAIAGADQEVWIGLLVTLDGSGSSDEDGDALTYSWSFTSNPGNVALSDSTSANPTFTPDVDGVYVLNLVVSDGELSSPADTVTITVTPKYQFVGFLAPLDNPPAVNKAKAGRTLQVKFQLTDESGAYISDLGAVTGIWYQKFQCGGTSGGAMYETGTGGSSLLYKNGPNKFIYKWETDKTMIGCYSLILEIFGSGRYQLDFKLK
jgi:hypothetical protein